ACGTPVVAVAEGGVRETVIDGVTGWLVERDCEAFVEKLEMLLFSDKMRLSMGQAGVEYVSKNWTWGHAVDLLENEFEFYGN
ncbi:MAG TPA: glycosyltransferase, partial [Oculatellaceae cyanobacterium]